MVDFVPDVCNGISIFECFTLRDCSLDELIDDLDNPLSDISAGFDADFGLLLEIEAELDIADACITAAIVSAFAIAGEPFPTPPTPDPPLDFTSVQNDLNAMESEVTERLGALDSIFTLEDDGTKITRIISA